MRQHARIIVPGDVMCPIYDTRSGRAHRRGDRATHCSEHKPAGYVNVVDSASRTRSKQSTRKRKVVESTDAITSHQSDQLAQVQQMRRSSRSGISCSVQPTDPQTQTRWMMAFSFFIHAPIGGAARSVAAVASARTAGGSRSARSVAVVASVHTAGCGIFAKNATCVALTTRTGKI